MQPIFYSINVIGPSLLNLRVVYELFHIEQKFYSAKINLFHAIIKNFSRIHQILWIDQVLYSFH
jgi:hypothetical protein